MREMVSRSIFSWDHAGVTKDEITTRKQASRTSLFMRTLLRMKKVRPGIIQSWETLSGRGKCKVISSGRRKHHSLLFLRRFFLRRIVLLRFARRPRSALFAAFLLAGPRRLRIVA